jgi:hypothetical protein
MLVYTVMRSSGITMLEGKFAARSNPRTTLDKPNACALPSGQAEIAGQWQLLL